VSVAYSVLEAGAKITVDILDSNGWSWWGNGIATIPAAGSGTVTITVTEQANLPCTSTLVLNGWVVTSADYAKPSPWTLAKASISVPTACGTASNAYMASTADEAQEQSNNDSASITSESGSPSYGVPGWAAALLVMASVFVVLLVIALFYVVRKPETLNERI